MWQWFKEANGKLFGNVLNLERRNLEFNRYMETTVKQQLQVMKESCLRFDRKKTIKGIGKTRGTNIVGDKRHLRTYGLSALANVAYLRVKPLSRSL